MIKDGNYFKFEAVDGAIGGAQSPIDAPIPTLPAEAVPPVLPTLPPPQEVAPVTSPYRDEVVGREAETFNQMSGQLSTEDWRSSAKKYVELEGDSYLQRVGNAALNPADLKAITDSLLESAEQGVPSGLFYSTWRLLSTDIPHIIRKYPEFKRTLDMAKQLRKRPAWEAVQARMHNHPQTAIKMLSDAKLTDEDDGTITDSAPIDERIESILVSKGIEPCEYSQVLVLHGDLPSEDYIPTPDDYEFLGVPAEQLLAELYKKDRGDDLASKLSIADNSGVHPGAHQPPAIQFDFSQLSQK